MKEKELRDYYKLKTDLFRKYLVAPEDVRSWLELDVTKVFLGYINIELLACDEGVHFGITHESNKPSILAEGGLQACQEILDIPSEIISDINDLKKTDQKKKESK